MLRIIAVVVLILAQTPTREWRDPSPHRAYFVDVQKDVRLEVLDWGGSGRSIVLLTGSGSTAHIYDEFAPKVTAFGHVYGITRRGYGSSSHPESGYDNQRLADDILAVLNALRIDAPVLVGHSMAGGEMTTLGNQHSDRLAGLVYLDALGDPRDWPASDPAYMEILRNLPASSNESPPPDYSSFSAHRAWQVRTRQGGFPESELRELFVSNPDGTMGRYKASTGSIHRAIGDGEIKRDYSRIQVPVLAFLEFPRTRIDQLRPDEYHPKNDQERAAIEAHARAIAAFIDRWMKNLKAGVPNARLVDLPGAGHFVFLTREADVLRELRTFVAELK